jgi:hypothetical protein
VRSERLWRHSGRGESAYGAAGGCRSDPSARGKGVSLARGSRAATPLNRGEAVGLVGGEPTAVMTSKGMVGHCYEGGVTLDGRTTWVARDGRGGPGEQAVGRAWQRGRQEEGNSERDTLRPRSFP